MDQASKNRRREDAKERCAVLVGEEIQTHEVGSKELDLSAAFDAHLQATGARCYSGAALGLHLIVGVSPEWVAEAGDPHDAKTPRVQDLMRAARDWAEDKIGDVWAVRYDLDEKGSAVVDVLCSPVRAHKATGQPWVSTRKALGELAASEKKPASRNYSAMQDSWARHARQRLDPAFERGKDAKKTGLKHLRPEEYGRLQDAKKTVAADARSVHWEALRVDHDRETLQADQKALAAERAALRRERADTRAFGERVRMQALEVLRRVGKRLAKAGREAAATAREQFSDLVRLTGDKSDERTRRIGTKARSGRIRTGGRTSRAGRARSERDRWQREPEREGGRERESPGAGAN